MQRSPFQSPVSALLRPYLSLPESPQHEAEGEASAGEKPAETMTVEKFAAEARFHLLSVGLLTSKSRSPWNIECASCRPLLVAPHSPLASSLLACCGFRECLPAISTSIPESEGPRSDFRRALSVRFSFRDNKGGTVEAEDVKISDSEKVHVPRFLNRLLGLAPPVQKMLFDFFQEILDRVISRARRDGVFDDGIVDIKGDIKLIGKSAVVYRDVFSQASPGRRREGADEGESVEADGERGGGESEAVGGGRRKRESLEAKTEGGGAGGRVVEGGTGGPLVALPELVFLAGANLLLGPGDGPRGQLGEGKADARARDGLCHAGPPRRLQRALPGPCQCGLPPLLSFPP